MTKVKSFITKIFNPLLISRFLAKNIDLLLGQMVGIIILMMALNHGIKLDPLSMSLGMAFLTIVLEAICLFYFHVTPGKFFMGLRVYPDSFKSSFQRSFSCYFRALGLGIPVLGLVFSFAYYLLGINNKEIPWDKYAKVTQQRKHFITGITSALVINTLILIVVSSLHWAQNQKEEAAEEVSKKSSALETVVGYPGFNDFSKPDSELTEEEQSVSDVWNMACRLGAVGLLDFYQGPLLERSIAVISASCERGMVEIAPEDDIEVIYMKACGYGIGVGAALIFKEDIENSPIVKDGEKLLKEICLPNFK